MRTATFFLFLHTFVFMAVVSASDARPAAPKRLHFHGGVARARGYLHHIDSKAVFVFHGREGQHVSARTGGDTVMIKFPNGEEEGAPGATGDCVVPKSGDCLVTVTHHHMAEFEPGPVTLKVDLHDADSPKKDR